MDEEKLNNGFDLPQAENGEQSELTEQLPGPGKHHRKFSLGSFLAGMIAAVLIAVIAVAALAGNDLFSEYAYQKKLAVLKTYISRYFLFDTDVDYSTEMLKGYVEALDDPYSVYYTAEEYEKLKESGNGTYCGIGVQVQQNAETGIITCISVFEGYGADQAGMQKDDILYKVEGEEVTGKDVDLVVAEIRGEENTTVSLTIYRPSENEYIDMTVTRMQVTEPSVYYTRMDDNIAYLQITGFAESTDEQFTEAFEQLKQEGCDKLIIDLRDNGGGYLDTAVHMLDYLLPEGVVTYTVDKNGNRIDYTSDASEMLDGMPVVILTNGNSASASELFTGAMKDFGAAVSVGTTTFGKGIVQKIIPLSDGTALKLTTARYYLPSGTCIHETGIDPDIEIEYDKNSETDNQLQAAIEYLTEQ